MTAVNKKTEPFPRLTFLKGTEFDSLGMLGSRRSRRGPVLKMRSAPFLASTMMFSATIFTLDGCGATKNPLDGLSGSSAARSTERELGLLPNLNAPQLSVMEWDNARTSLGGPASWMAPDAKSKNLLYVTDVKTVTVYSYPRGRLEGVLKFGHVPLSECVDKNGDVYITNIDNGEIVEYSHGARRPLAVLHSPGPDPVGCAVDPTSGDLAVASLGFGSNGSVAIYKHARGKPVTYQNPAFQEYYYCGYDSTGNLFVDGQDANSVFRFAELAKGSTRLKVVKLDQTIGWPGGVQWDGQHLAVGDQNAPSVVYEFMIGHDRGVRVGTTALGSNVGSVAQFFIIGQRLIAPNQCNGSCYGDVRYYSYPAGGAATKVIANEIRYPHGAVVSPAVQ